MENLKKKLSIIWTLSRLRMTIFSAVTYSVFFSIGLRKGQDGAEIETFSIAMFIWGWLFVLLCQLTAHFLGEFYDLKSDSLNRHASPFTGGSRVLVSGAFN